ncbi:MAG TPA: efflux RND transporter periplasmic adaptor subunit [Gemmatimonadaceae bacterium]|nr:efflux RND transporter periplasmic adaptor subunit [Gemmatimonadaceae bacterium]
MRVSRRAVGLSVAFLAIAALGGFTFLQMRGAQAGAAAGDADSTATARRIADAAKSAGSSIAIPVEGVPVVRDTLVISVSATGQAAPYREVILSAQVPGRIAELPVRESDRVGNGALVVALDAEEMRIALEDARAQLRTREATYREQTLFDDRIEDAALRARRDSTARAKSGMESARLAVEKAELDLRRTHVTAPFPGQVANVKVVPGQYVRVGDELATVVDLDPIKVEVQVLESEVGYLGQGRHAQVSFAAFPGETFTGTIQTINPVVDQTTRTARVTVVVPNPTHRVLPGMYARVQLEARRFPDRVLVPRVAVLERDIDRRTLVFVYEGDERGGEAKWRYVKTGIGNADLVEIVDDPEVQGVKPGEIVLTDGHVNLTDGARVRLVENVAQDAGRRP